MRCARWPMRWSGPGSEAAQMSICWSGQLGRAICTITLLRLISEPELRAQIDAATNKVESYNSFSGWLAFGSEGIERTTQPSWRR